jgi:hypothetical protein
MYRPAMRRYHRIVRLLSLGLTTTLFNLVASTQNLIVVRCET